MTQARSLVTIGVWDGVADVRLARAEKINALNPALFEAVSDAIAELEKRREVRCVVLSGEGRGFCVGVDLEALAQSDALKTLAPRTHDLANLVQNAAWGWRTLSVPVIAAVHGFAFGAGFQIMLGADIRIAAPDAQFSMMELRWGLVPDVAGIALLRGLVRDDIAREITFTARKFSGEEAATLGLVTRLSPEPRAAALELAREIASASPQAVRAAKRLLNLSRDPGAGEILLAESREQEALLNSAGHAETLVAARERRPPRFAD
jgi:enoyl-CoA hydratase/carnithine racemase